MLTLLAKSIFLLCTAWCSAEVAERCVTEVLPAIKYTQTNLDCCCAGYRDPCPTLEAGLTCIEKHNSNIELYINSGSYTMNRSFTFQKVRNVAIVGNSTSNNVFQQGIKIDCSKSHVAGFLFIDAYNVTFMNLELIRCAMNHSMQAGAVIFVNSSGVALKHMTILFSHGYGIIFKDACGFINLSHSTLLDNEGGMRLIFSNDSYECYTHVLIEEIIAFKNNVTNSTNEGGGINVMIYRSYINIFINNSQFSSNTAQYGGGLFLLLAGNTSGNVIYILQTSFDINQYFNDATPDKQYHDSRGGGIRLVFNTTNTNNSVTFDDCDFRSNTAAVGAALSIISSHTKSIQGLKNTVTIVKADITHNSGILGSAFHAESMKDHENGFALILVVQNCDITNNHLSDIMNQAIGAGVAFSSKIEVHFRGKNTLKYNFGSALTVSATAVHFLNNSETIFANNNGYVGGAIGFINTGYMIVHDNSHLMFQNNTAFSKGGAIAVTGYGELNYVTKHSQACFVKYSTTSIYHNTTQFVFSSNKAKGENNSMFLPSLKQCYINSKTPILCSKQWIYDQSNCSAEIKTLAAKMVLTSENHEVYPGFQTRLPIKLVDDLGHNVTLDTPLVAKYDGDKLLLDSNSVYISNGLCTLYKEIDYYKNASSYSLLKLHTISTRLLVEYVNITFLSCPPGYKEEKYREIDNRVYTKCLCDDFIATMLKCDFEHLQAFLYDTFCITPNPHPKHNTTVTYLFAQCLSPYDDGPKSDYHYNPLPKNSSNLNDLCGDQSQRTGYFCSKCRDSLGIDTNSWMFSCVKCSNNPKDIVKNVFLYVVVKFLPVILMFLVIIIFHVNLTHGPMNLYIWFCQSLSLPANIVQFQSHFNVDVSVSKKWYLLLFLPHGIWNFYFFEFFPIQVCISQHLKIIHVLTLDYFTALCPLLLIAITYACIEMHGNGVRVIMFAWKLFERCIRLFRKNWNAKHSTIDVFAAFILLSYTKFTNITFSLLVPNPVFNSNGEIVYYLTNVDPSIQYGSSEHMPFLILAIVVLIVVVLLPPLILLIYSFTQCGRIRHWISIRQHLALIAFVDAFQGGFKDGINGTNDCRYMASIYLFVRVLTVTTTFFSWNLEIERMSQFLMLNAVLLVIGFVKPYKLAINNSIDVAILIFMSCILAISSFYAFPGSARTDSIYLEILFGFFILVIPFCFTGYLFYTIFKALFKILKQLVQDKFRCLKHSCSQGETQLLLSQCIEDSLPDRISNPDSYK